MGIRITTQEGKVALFDSTTGFAFGKIFDSVSEAEDFVAWFDKMVFEGEIEVQTHLTDYRRSDFEILLMRHEQWKEYFDES